MIVHRIISLRNFYKTTLNGSQAVLNFGCFWQNPIIWVSYVMNPVISPVNNALCVFLWTRRRTPARSDDDNPIAGV